VGIGQKIIIALDFSLANNGDLRLTFPRDVLDDSLLQRKQIIYLANGYWQDIMTIAECVATAKRPGRDTGVRPTD